MEKVFFAPERGVARRLHAKLVEGVELNARDLLALRAVCAAYAAGRSPSKKPAIRPVSELRRLRVQT